jgi:glycerol-3-phosphate dehydrogenase
MGTVDVRGRALERLVSERFDLLVAGGGIVGAGVAALAAEQGLRVALVDRADFASGTSSASSKLIHGGLRYLRLGDFRLVWEALQEARALSGAVAPHLIRPLRFLLPVYDDGPYGRAAIRSALWIYRALAGQGAGEMRVVDPAEAASLVPSLRTEHLRGAGLYADAQTNDARLCLANIRAAADRGAAVLNYAELVGLERAGGDGYRAVVQERAGGGSLSVAARCVVNATGPWIDEVRRLEDPRAGRSVSLSKGCHLVLPLPDGWSAALTVPVDRSRVSFALPWEGALLLGTTDEPFDAPPDELAVTPEDELQILREAGAALVPDAIPPGRVLARFAGLRVLPVARGGTSSVRREVTVSRGPQGVVTVAGGKLTTYRRIAASVLDALRAELGLRRPRVAAAPLPGACDPGLLAASLRRSHPDLEGETVATLVRTYGALAGDVLSYADELPEALEPLATSSPELVAQAWYARDREWALGVDDVLRRRTTLALRGFHSPELCARVERLLTTVPIR